MKEISEGRLSAAQATLDEAVATDGADHPDIEPFRLALTEKRAMAQKYYKEVLKFKQKKQARKAKQFLVERAMKFWSDNPEYEGTLAELSRGSPSTSKKG